ncbi:OprO/OprP family phosphate-selective porin [Sphingomonas changnyeongensis]|nr:porin [Sphingomonas changnyeongensis]
MRLPRPAPALVAALAGMAPVAPLAAQASAPPLAAQAVSPPPPELPPRRSAVPEWQIGDDWSLKLRGRINHDVAAISAPGGLPAGTVPQGIAVQTRRLRLGVEGDGPDGLSYKGELELSGNRVRAVDVALTFRASRTAPVEFTIGHIEPLNGHEQIASSRYTSTIERGAYNEAFSNIRRSGAYLTIIPPGADLRVSAGLFADTVNSGGGVRPLTLATRTVWAPRVRGVQLHIGANAAWRRYRDGGSAFALSARPFAGILDARLLGTGRLAAVSDLTLGAEFIAIAGPFHLIAEGQHLGLRTLRAGTAPGLAAGAIRPGFDPHFAGMIAEIGWSLTGESRGYRDGLWARTRPRRPLGRGGIGALAINLRYDLLDLNDAGGNARIAGGRQQGHIAALVWQPTDHLRFTVQYARGRIDGGPLARPDRPGFGFDVMALRTAWDF